jgi:hypothetical protein
MPSFADWSANLLIAVSSLVRNISNCRSVADLLSQTEWMGSFVTESVEGTQEVRGRNIVFGFTIEEKLFLPRSTLSSLFLYSFS